MLVVHGTKKFLDRVRGTPATEQDSSTTLLGSWYATTLFWKPQVALFVNEVTLLPLLLPFAPAASLLERFSEAAGSVLRAHRVRAGFVKAEVTEMAEARVSKTKNRSILGIMNEFAYLGEVWHRGDLLELSLRLAETPCSPLDRRHGSPDRELAAFVSEHSPDS
ncbi:MAG: DUF6933 domain-containing protein [Nitrososphaerales archaeon]